MDRPINCLARNVIVISPKEIEEDSKEERKNLRQHNVKIETAFEADVSLSEYKSEYIIIGNGLRVTDWELTRRIIETSGLDGFRVNKIYHDEIEKIKREVETSRENKRRAKWRLRLLVSILLLGSLGLILHNLLN